MIGCGDRVVTRDDRGGDMERIAKLTKRTVDAAQPEGARYIVWDADLKGFGLRVEPTGAKSFVVRYRVGGGRTAPRKQVKLGNMGVLTPEEARTRAKEMLAAVTGGMDPAAERERFRGAPTMRELATMFLADHVEAKRKGKTHLAYKGILDHHVLPAFGSSKAESLTRAEVARLHTAMKATPYQANRMLAVIGSLYAFASKRGLVPEDLNPARKIEKFRERKRERFLSSEELERVGAAIALAEADGVTLERNGRPTVARISPPAAAAIRLLLFTGARVSEILSLEWSHVDFERGCLNLPDSKTGSKAVLLSPPALSVLAGIEREEGNPFVIHGQRAETRLTDLKRPWGVVQEAAGLEGVRIHDLRHTFASVGAGAGLGLAVIGKLLGHTQAATTHRYAHLADDPLRRANNQIGRRIADALAPKPRKRPAAEG